MDSTPNRLWWILPFLPALAGALFLWHVAAQDPPNYGKVWDTPCLTHSGPPELDAMVAHALDEWGRTSTVRDCGPGDDIVISYVSEGAAGTAYVHGFDEITSCEIEISASLDLTGWYGRFVPGHEVGHCLGLDEAPEGTLSIMRGVQNGWTEYDREAIAFLYPPEPPIIYHVIAPGLVKSTPGQ